MQKKMSEFNNKQKDMYKCKCGEIICKECKENHEEQNKNDEENEEDKDDADDDEKKHNLVNYSEKEFKCTCTEEIDDYYYFCRECNKNLCSTCEAEHSKHPIYNFYDEINETKNQKADKKCIYKEDKIKRFEKQKKYINKFLKKVYKLKEKFEEKIEQLNKTIQAYLEINNFILKCFSEKAMNYQTIKNIKNINLDFPNIYDIFINATNEKDSFYVLISLFDYQDKNNQNFIMKKDYISSRASSSINISKMPNKELKDKLDEPITSICQYENGIAVGDCKGEIHIYTLNKTQLKKKYSILDYKGNDIKFLYSLKNGYIISSIYNEFQIYELSDKGIGYEKLQTFKYSNFPDNRLIKPIKLNKNIKNNKNNNNENILSKYHYQIIELINKYLIYIDGNKLIILKPILENNYQKDPFKTIDLESNIISITELVNNKFSVYCENKNLIIFDSENFKQKKIIKNLTKIETLQKIAGVNNDIMAALGNSHLYLISEAKEGIIDEKILNQYNFLDFCTQLNSIIGITKNHLFQFDIKLNSEGKYINNKRESDINKNNEIKKINQMYLLNYENNNERIVIIYDDLNIKVI